MTKILIDREVVERACRFEGGSLGELRDALRAALEAAPASEQPAVPLAAGGEPVAWQKAIRRADEHGMTIIGWEPCTEREYRALMIPKRALYAAPQSGTAEQPLVHLTGAAVEELERECANAKHLGDAQDAVLNFVTAARASLAAAPSAPASPRTVEEVPPGWKLVPIEPTREMLDADWNVTMSDAHTDGGVAECAWAAMLAAAPEAGKEPVHSAQPAHSKSEYKRRVALGDESVLPPAGDEVGKEGAP